VQIDVNGARLWFDVEGLGLVPDGSTMRRRPTLVLVHGGPASYDHSYFKPHFARLADVAQVVYLDLRDHGRSSRHDPAAWTFEQCADDVRAFCDTLGIERPVVLGHSMGGFVTILYGARHPGHASGLVLASTAARFDLERLVDGFRAVAGKEVAELARRSYGGAGVDADEWARIYAAFGPTIPDPLTLARRVGNPAVAAVGGDQLLRLDVRDQLPGIASPTLVVTGSLDPVLPASAAREIAEGLRPDIGRLAILEGVGHFPWLDDPDGFFGLVARFVASPVTA
jgi:proline iminopeptidase